MGKKSRQKNTIERQERSPAASAVSGPTPARKQSRIKHRWLARLIAAVIVPLFLFALVEGGLRLFGYGYSTKFFVPTDDGKTLTTNPKFAWQYYSKGKATSPTPVLFPKEKAAGTARIFILGESAAAGTPDPAFSFSRMLELMLRDQYPSNHFEIINAAMRGIDTHIIRAIAAECAELSPDLFIVYAGNNDMIGLHSPTPGEFRLTSNIHWFRFKDSLSRLKLMQLGNLMLAGMRKADGPKQDMEFFRRNRMAFDDPKRNQVYEHYEHNLRDISAFAEKAGARTLLCTVGANLRDFPPLASLHAANLAPEQLEQWKALYAAGAVAEVARNYTMALSNFVEAARIDGHYAELFFRMGRCHDALGNSKEAQQCFALARDWDAMQFRTDGRLNAVVRSTATNSSDRVQLVDVETMLARSPLAENGVPGRRIFQEHVHFTFDGDHQFASILLPAVADALKFPKPSKPVLSREDCARALAYTIVDDINVRTAVNRLTDNPPFLDQLDHGVRQLKATHDLQEVLRTITERETKEAIAIYNAAVAARPDDWMLQFNFGNILSQLNQHASAIPYYEAAVKKLPNQKNFRFALANTLLKVGKPADAREQFQAILRTEPDFKPALDGLKATGGGGR
jgi:tetratricopeptide (TPR) repeat protein